MPDYVYVARQQAVHTLPYSLSGGIRISIPSPAALGLVQACI